jgi:hypothetical protein
LQNIAELPISYLVNDIDFRIQNTVGNNQFTTRGTTIDAQQFALFSSDIVSFHQPVNLPVVGFLRATIVYGKPGKEKFNRPVSIGMRYFADPSTPSGIGYHWWIVNQ